MDRSRDKAMENFSGGVIGCVALLVGWELWNRQKVSSKLQIHRPNWAPKGWGRQILIGTSGLLRNIVVVNSGLVALYTLGSWYPVTRTDGAIALGSRGFWSIRKNRLAFFDGEWHYGSNVFGTVLVSDGGTYVAVQDGEYLTLYRDTLQKVAECSGVVAAALDAGTLYTVGEELKIYSVGKKALQLIHSVRGKFKNVQAAGGAAVATDGSNATIVDAQGTVITVVDCPGSAKLTATCLVTVYRNTLTWFDRLGQILRRVKVSWPVREDDIQLAVDDQGVVWLASPSAVWQGKTQAGLVVAFQN